MLIIVNRLEWLCDRCDSNVPQKTVSVVLPDGSEAYLCRQHLGEVIREEVGEHIEEFAHEEVQ